MASTTGIELGPDSCVLVGGRPGTGGVVDVRALRVMEAASWPTTEVAQTEALRELRTSKRFPRAARVVVWGLPEEPPADEAISRAGLRPFTAAGFRVEAVMTPPQALAILAAARPRPSGGGAVAWLTLNMHGAAIAIVRGGELLFSRTFGWSYNPGEMTSKGQLLQRYTLVAHLGPEVRRGMAAVLASHGVAVDAIVTCGDLPELRSLTMPLIEELDLEVETLDSTEGLRPVGKAKLERFAESAPAIRLASAAALAPAAVRRRSGVNPLAVAAVAIIAALTWGGYRYVSRPAVRPAAAVQASRAAAPAPAPAAARPRPPASLPVSRENIPATPPAQKPASAATAPRTSAAAATIPPSLVAPKPVAKVEPVTPKATAQEVPRPSKPPEQAPSAPKPTVQAAPVAPKPVAKAEPVAPKPVAKAEVPTTGIQAPNQVVRPPALQIARPPAAGVEPAATPPPARTAIRQAPLKDPLPRVDSILIDQDRRLAIVEGAIVAVGDAVGPRIVGQIERNAVLFQEPSGLLIRVPMRPKP